MERETGLEPATYSLEGCRSSQLSYSRIMSTLFKGPIACALLRQAQDKLRLVDGVSYSRKNFIQLSPSSYFAFLQLRLSTTSALAFQLRRTMSGSLRSSSSSFIFRPYIKPLKKLACQKKLPTGAKTGGESRIRTCEGLANGFTDRPL